MDVKKPLTAAKAVVALYYFQTFDEQQIGGTVYRNNQGFNAVDAEIGTSIAQQLLAGRPITGKQLAVLVRILPKYKRQLGGVDLGDVKLPERVVDMLTRWEDRANEKVLKKPKSDKPELTGSGMLGLDPSGRLEFTPNIYPTNQIKGHGFRRGKRAWWTWTSHFSYDKVRTVLALWPDVAVTEELAVELRQLLKLESIPDWVADHDVLFEFQKEAIQFLSTYDRAMLALAPGLGKTACSIFAKQIYEDAPTCRVLVVAPLTLLETWKREISKWIATPSTLFYGKADSWVEPETFEGWAITNYDTVRLRLGALLQYDWDAIIVDESVLVKNRKAQRTKAVKSLCVGVDRVWMLSGAPTTRFYDDMWAQLNILDPKRFSSYWRFAEKYCVVEKGQWGWSIVANAPNAEQELQHDLADIYFARTQDQVLDLPEWLFDEVYVPLPDDQWQLYNQMEMRFRADLPDGDVVLAPNVLSQLTRLIQLASNPMLIDGPDIGTKWQAAIDLLKFERLPAIIWTSYIDTADQMWALLLAHKFNVGMLTGQTNKKHRQEVVDQFQGGELDVIVAHPGVGKFGLTLTAARTAIYLERSYSGDDYYQSLHRVRRIGTTESPHVIHMLATSPTGTSTVDWAIHRILKFRKDSSIALTTGMLQQAWEDDYVG